MQTLHFFNFRWAWATRRVRRVIFAIKTSTSISACNPSIKALTIFFLTLWFFANASFAYFSCAFALDAGFSLCHQMLMILVVVASITGTFRRAHFPSRKALAISFQAVSLATSASSFLFLNNNRNKRDFFLSELYFNGVLLILIRMGADMSVIKICQRTCRQIFYCLDHQQCIVDHVQGG